MISKSDHGTDPITKSAFLSCALAADPEFRIGVFREVLRALLIMGILWTVHSYFLANPPREVGPTTEETVRRIQSDLSRMQRP